MKDRIHNFDGVVIEALSNLQFRIELTDGRIVRAYLAGRLHQKFVRVVVGDKVVVVVPPQSEIGRITRRN